MAEQRHLAANGGRTTTPTQVEAVDESESDISSDYFRADRPSHESKGQTHRTLNAITGRETTECNATQRVRQSPQTLQVGLLSVSAS